MNNIVRILFELKKTPNLIKKLFLCFVSKPRVGLMNSKHFTFKWGNIFASICTLVLSLWRTVTFPFPDWDTAQVQNLRSLTCSTRVIEDPVQEYLIIYSSKLECLSLSVTSTQVWYFWARTYGGVLKGLHLVKLQPCPQIHFRNWRDLQWQNLR